jgi:hypothetical protein
MYIQMSNVFVQTPDLLPLMWEYQVDSGLYAELARLKRSNPKLEHMEAFKQACANWLKTRAASVPVAPAGSDPVAITPAVEASVPVAPAGSDPVAIAQAVEASVPATPSVSDTVPANPVEVATAAATPVAANLAVAVSKNVYDQVEVASEPPKVAEERASERERERERRERDRDRGRKRDSDRDRERWSLGERERAIERERGEPRRESLGERERAVLQPKITWVHNRTMSGKVVHFRQ